MKFIRDWLATKSTNSIVGDLHDRYEILTIWALRSAKSLDAVDYEPFTETIENGMLWVRRNNGSVNVSS